MMMTTKGRYAVMAMVDIAINSNGRPLALADISERQGITVAYLEQLFSKLKKAGLVSANKGPGGGYMLNKDKSEITVSEVIDAVDENIKMTRCISDGCMDKGAKCLTHDLWDGLGNHISSYLRDISLNDVCSGNIYRGSEEEQIKLVNM